MSSYRIVPRILTPAACRLSQIQEKKKMVQISILANLCRDIESELISQKWPQLRQHQKNSDVTLNMNTQNWTMRDEIRKTPHETPKTLATNILPNLGWDIDSRQFSRKGPGFRQHQEHNDATLNTHTKIWAVRNKIRKKVHETEKMSKISIPANLCRDINSKQFLRKLPEARQHLEHNHKRTYGTRLSSGL